MTSETSCCKRVWSNGDMDPCGKQVAAEGLCDEHLSSSISALRGKLAVAEASVAVLRERLTKLESGRKALVDRLLRPAPEPTPRQLNLMRHALGVQLKAGRYTRPYGNYYVPGGDDVAEWEELVCAGWGFKSREPSEASGGDPVYSVTAAGAELALANLRFERKS